MIGRARRELHLEQPPHPTRGPSGSPVTTCTLSYRADPPPYPVPKGYKRGGEWSCVATFEDGSHGEADWIPWCGRMAWSWRSWGDASNASGRGPRRAVYLSRAYANTLSTTRHSARTGIAAFRRF